MFGRERKPIGESPSAVSLPVVAVRSAEARDIRAVRVVKVCELAARWYAFAEPVLEIGSLTVSRVQFFQVDPFSKRERCEWAQFIEQFDDAFHGLFPFCGERDCATLSQ